MHQHWCHMMLIVLSIIPVNHYNDMQHDFFGHMTNAIVSLMAVSASHDRKHVIAMYILKTNMPPNTTHKPHMPISSCAHIRQLHSIHAPYEPNAISNVTWKTGIHTFHITGICPSTNMPPTSHIYVCTAPVLCF